MLKPFHLDILRDLRQRAGLTQGEMARLCGLRGRQSYQTAGAWERGEMIPNRSRRAKFISYLWDALGLRKDPTCFEKVWEILVEEWDWEPISDKEWATYTRQLRPQHINIDDKEGAHTWADLVQTEEYARQVTAHAESSNKGSTYLLPAKQLGHTISAQPTMVAESGMVASTEHIQRIEHTLTLNYDQSRPEDACRVLTTWLLTNMSMLRSDKPVWYEVKLHTRV